VHLSNTLTREQQAGPDPATFSLAPRRSATELLLHGGTGWTLTSVARVAIGYLDPRSRCQGCGGGHRTPDAVVNGHPLYR
jgi:hypothetical protein